MQVSDDQLAIIDRELDGLGKSESEIAAILERFARVRPALEEVDGALEALAAEAGASSALLEAARAGVRSTLVATPEAGAAASGPTSDATPARPSDAAPEKKSKKKKRKGRASEAEAIAEAEAVVDAVDAVAAPPAPTPTPAPTPETTTDRGRTAAELLAEAMGDSEFPPPLDAETAEAEAEAEAIEAAIAASERPSASAAAQMAEAVEGVGSLESALFDEDVIASEDALVDEPVTIDEPIVSGEPVVDDVSFMSDLGQVFESEVESEAPAGETEGGGASLDALFEESFVGDGEAPIADLEASPSAASVEDELFGDDDEPEEGTSIFTMNDIDAIREDARKSSLPPPEQPAVSGDELDGALEGMLAESSPYGAEPEPDLFQGESTSTAERVSAAEMEMLVDDDIMMLDEDEILVEDELDGDEEEATMIASVSNFPPPRAPSASQPPPSASQPPPEDDDAPKKKGFFKKLFGGD